MANYARPRPFSPTRVAVIGNYLPRQCGIATFTTDLCEALTADHAAPNLFAIAVNDADAEYSYPERVRYELRENDLASYRAAAEFLNFNNVDLVCLQHEYGIFGGEAGSHILWLLRSLKMPIVTTLHTVLRDPNPEQRKVMEELAKRTMATDKKIEQARIALKHRPDVLQLIHQATLRPQCVFVRDWSNPNPMEILYPEFPKMRVGVRILVAESPADGTRA